MLSARGDHDRRRVTPALAGTAVALLLLTGCQGSGEPTAEETRVRPSSSAAPTTAEASPSASASAAPEPSPASSAGPAANIPVPVKPALADENSVEGLEAFTEYWLELFSYGYETNDWAPFDSVTDPGCNTCSNVRAAVGDVYESEGWIAGGETNLTNFHTDFVMNTEGSFNAIAEVVQSDSQVYLKSGELDSDDPRSAPRVNTIFAVYMDESWRMLDFGAPEGTE